MLGLRIGSYRKWDQERILTLKILWLCIKFEFLKEGMIFENGEGGTK
jgi:hypothetical protein